MDSKEFIRRRKEVLKKMKDGELAILFAGLAPRKSADETHPYVPNRNFYYLTGVDEEKDILLLFKWNGMEQQVLFISRYDELKAKWVGATYSDEQAKKLSGIGATMYLDEFEDIVGSFLSRASKLYLDLERQGYNETPTRAHEFAEVIAKKYPAVQIANIYNTLAEMRMVKSKAELDVIRHAISITNKGILELMKHAKESIGKPEYYLEAYFDKTIKQEGANDFAFETIAAGGKNACVLHYRANDSELKDGDLVLFDLGAEYNYYKSDITRTFPLNGKFTEKQKKVYEIVLEGQKVVQKYAKPGISTAQLNQKLIAYFIPQLKKLGLIKRDEEYIKYYFHGCSHHIGLDTHDAQVMNAPLKAGCVISNEPGLYIPEWNIGIRIEDDLLITNNGCEVLSAAIIRDIKDIEKFMK